MHVSEMHFGFMSGRGTADAIFIASQLQEKYLRKNPLLHLCRFGKGIQYSSQGFFEMGYENAKFEWLIEITMGMHESSNSAVRVNNVGNKYTVEVGLHQGYALNPQQVLKALSSEFRKGPP